MWIARGNNKQLFVFTDKPVRNEYDLIFDGCACLELNGSEFPEVTWKNSPVEIKAMPNKEKGIDWEQRRYEIAKDALIGVLAAPIVPGMDPNLPSQKAAQWSVEYADALIEELKK